MNAPTNSNTTNVQLPPVLAAYINGIRPGMYILLFCAVWLGVMIPLLVVLFYTSSKSLRRSPIFISNAIGISIGITLGILNVAIQTNGILNPLKGLNRAEVLAYTFISITVGPYVDSILFFRVVVVFPRCTTSKRVWLGIMVPLVLLKLARLVNVVVFMCQFASKTRGLAQDSTQYEPTVRRLIGETIEWSLQLVDNTICSSLFLWTLRTNKATDLTTISGLSLKSMKSSYPDALATLFWIAATNFVFPCLFDVILFVLFFKDPDSSHYLIVLISNIYVQIIGVLFATVWRATRQTLTPEDTGAGPGRPRDLSIQFARNHGTNSDQW